MLVRVEKKSKKQGKRGKKPGSANPRRIRASLGSIGPYQMAPAAVASKPRTNRAPRINNKSAGRMTVSHMEFMATVRGTEDFTVIGWPLNPARDATFNWLSDTATRFAKYRFRNLRFDYRDSCSSTIAGEILLIVDPNASQPPPVSQQAAYSYQNSKRCVPWQECSMNVSNLVLNKELMTLAGKQPANTDIKTYNVGNFYLCTSGFAAGNVACGVLTVSYDVELINPIVQNTVQSSVFLGTPDQNHLFVGDPVGLLDIVATGAGSAVLFGQAFHGVVSMDIEGTFMDVGIDYAGSTVAVGPIHQAARAGATQLIAWFEIVAERGDILQLALTSGLAFIPSVVQFTPMLNG